MICQNQNFNEIILLFFSALNRDPMLTENDLPAIGSSLSSERSVNEITI